MQKDPYPFDDLFSVALALRIVGDPVLCSRLAPHIDPERFENPDVALAIEHTRAIWERFGKSPNRIEVLQSIRSEIDAGKCDANGSKRVALLYEQAEGLPCPSREFLLEQVLSEERKTAMRAALDLGLRTLHLGDHEKIAEAISKASRLGAVDESPGVDLVDSLEARTQDRLSGKVVKRWSTGISDLDDLLKGGLAAGEVGCILGAAKAGKSFLLQQMAVSCASMGGTVLYYSFELSEELLLNRTDSAIAGVLTDDIAKKATYVQEAIKAWRKRCGGRIRVKQFAPKSASMRDVEDHMVMLRESYCVEPTMVIVDYGDEVGYEGRGDDGRFSELGNVYTGMKRVAKDWGLPLWTASQGTRGILLKSTPGAEDLGESMRKAQVVDALVAIAASQEEIDSGVRRLHNAICRFAKSGVSCGPFQTDFGRGRFALLDEFGHAPL